MRFLNLLRISCKRFTNKFISNHLHQHTANWKVPFYGTGFLSGVYLSTKYVNDQFYPFKDLKLTHVVMAENNENTKPKKTKTMNFLADAVEIAAPAVVHVDVVSQHRSYFHETNSSGSGFIVTEGGMVLTNAHVVGNASKVNVRLSTGETYKGSVIDVDRETDLAAVKLDNKSDVRIDFLHSLFLLFAST